MGIGAGFLVGMLFDQTLKGMIIGFAIGMGFGALVDAWRA